MSMDSNQVRTTQLLSSIQEHARLSLLGLRGHFALSLDIQEHDDALPLLQSQVRVFPLTETEAIILFPRHAALINARSKDTYWTLRYPPGSVAVTCDLEQQLLVLWDQTSEQLMLWNLETGLMICTLETGDYPTDMVFIPDSALVAVTNFLQGAQLWCWSSGGSALLYQLRADEDDYKAVRSIAVSPDGQYIATGDYESDIVWLWSSATGELVRSLKPPVEQAWMPHFNHATNQWERVWEYPHPDRRVCGLAFSQDGRLLVSGEAGGAWYTKGMPAWDRTTDYTAQLFSHKAHHPVFSPDGSYLAARGWPERIEEDESSIYRSIAIYLWDIATRQIVRTIKFKVGCTSEYLAFTPSGQVLISVDKDERVRWWDIRSGQEIYCIEFNQMYH